MIVCLDTNPYSDFKRGNRERQNIDELETFLAVPGVTVQDVTRGVARQYGILVNELRSRGTPIPTNGIWIATTTIETRAELPTRDEHFRAVPLLALYR